MKSRKVLFALVLALVLCLSASVAFAASYEVTDGSITTLLNAIKAGETDITIKTNAIKIDDGKSYTVTGSGVKITTSVTDVFTVEKGTLTLGNGITVEADSSILWANGSNATINVAGATLNGNGKYATAFAENGGTINVSAGSINGKQSAPYSDRVALDLGKNATVTISGGTVYSKGSSAIAVRENAKLTIIGGTVKSDAAAASDYAAIFAWDDATVSMTGGSVVANATQGMHVCEEAAGTISGGTVSGSTAVYTADKGTLAITGGSFSDDSALKYIPANMMIELQNGKFVVKAIPVELKNRTPQTGDNSNIALWISLMAISALSFVALGRKSRFN